MLKLQDPVQEWGEEEEDGAVFGITLRREPVLPASATAELPAAFIQYHTVKVRRLKAATLERLVTHLLEPEHQEPDFLHVFLATYRAFTTSSTLIELLFQRSDSARGRLTFTMWVTQLNSVSGRCCRLFCLLLKRDENSVFLLACVLRYLLQTPCETSDSLASVFPV